MSTKRMPQCVYVDDKVHKHYVFSMLHCLEQKALRPVQKYVLYVGKTDRANGLRRNASKLLLGGGGNNGCSSATLLARLDDDLGSMTRPVDQPCQLGKNFLEHAMIQ